MWHDSTVGGFVVPAGALYAAESMMIALTGTWASTLDDVKTRLVSKKVCKCLTS